MILVEAQGINVTFLKVSYMHIVALQCLFWPKMAVFGQNIWEKVLKIIRAGSTKLAVAMA